VKRIATIIGIVLILIVAAAAALPFWFGMETEKAYNNIVQELSSGTAISSQRYDRGWLSSTAETTMALSGSPLTVSMVHRISHGPLPIDRILGGDISLTPAMAFVDSEVKLVPKKGSSAAWLTEFTRRMAALNARTIVDLNGNAETTLKLPPSRSRGKTGVAFNSRGLSGTIGFHEGGQRVNIEVRAPGLSFSSDKGEFSLKNLIYRFNSSAGMAGYMFGNSTLQLAEVSAGPGFELKGLRLTTRSKPSGPNLTATVDYRVQAIKSGADEHGPGQLTLVLRKLDAKALQRFNQQYNQISKRGLPQQQASMMAAAEMMKLIAALSKKAPELEVTKLSFKTKEGELTGDAKIVLDGSDLDIAANPFLALRALRGEGQLSIPPSMVKAILTPTIMQDVKGFERTGALSTREAAKLTPAVMARIVDEAYPSYLSRNSFTKMLVRRGPVYRISASFRDGELRVNGKPLQQPLLRLSAS
jgi:uncharacterized protein YdgA (DUF945 family)